MPFANGDEPEVEAWVNEGKPIVEGVSISKFLQKREFLLLLRMPDRALAKQFNEDNLPPPFSYPYGSDDTGHEWKDASTQGRINAAKAPEQFAPSYAYDDDNAHLTVVTQFNVQDIMWLVKAAEEIRKKSWRVYMVSTDPDKPNNSYYYVLVPTTEEFRKWHTAAWRRLSKNSPFAVVFHQEDEKDVTW